MPKKPKILVHSCCTACTSHVLSKLKTAGFDPVVFFYNPQIDDKEEYQKRLNDLKNFSTENNVRMIIPEHLNNEYEDIIRPYRDKNSIKYINDLDRFRRKRCQFCNSLVIQRVVEQAKREKVKYFTTTLLCSPFKNHDELIEISNEKGLDYQLNFYYDDFRKGYWMGRNYARNHDVYIPRFCGCHDSKLEKRLE